MPLPPLSDRTWWVDSSGGESIVGDARIEVDLSTELRMYITFSSTDATPVAVDVALEPVKPKTELPRFFVFFHGLMDVGLVLGNASAQGIVPCSFHPLISVAKDDGTRRILSEGPFRARGSRDLGFLKVRGPEGSQFVVSFGPWWGGVTDGAAVLNLNGTPPGPSSDSHPILIPFVSCHGQNFVRVQTKLGHLRPFPPSTSAQVG